MSSSNPFAPPALEGIENINGEYLEYCYTPVLDSGTIAAGTEVQNIRYQLDGDATIILQGIQLIRHTFTVGDSLNFQLQFYDNEGQSLTNGYLLASNFGQGAVGDLIVTVPFPIVPGRYFPPGGFITTSIKNTGSSSITIQLAFRCVKRLKAQAEAGGARKRKESYV